MRYYGLNKTVEVHNGGIGHAKCERINEDAIALTARGGYGLETVSRVGREVKAKRNAPLRADERRIVQAMVQRPLVVPPVVSDSTGMFPPSTVESVEKLAMIEKASICELREGSGCKGCGWLGEIGVKLLKTFLPRKARFKYFIGPGSGGI